VTSPIPQGHTLTLKGAPNPGFTVHYHDVGDGPAVLFLHGSGPGASGWSNFAETAEVWAAAGHRCVMPDLPGYGLSDKPADVAYSFDFLAAAVTELLDHLGLPEVVLVGNSMGGALAIKLTLEQPNRVQRLVLMAPGGLETPDTYMAMRGIRSMLRCIFGPEGITREGMAIVFRKQLYDSSLVTDALIDARTAIALTQPTSLWKTMRVPNQADRLGELSCPILCLWGRDDQFCPVSGASTILQACDDVRVVTLSRCGHWVMVEHRALFDRVCLDFLDPLRVDVSSE